MLGVPIDSPTQLLGDNMSVVLNTTVPSSQLKKKHNAIAYHRVREAIAANIVNFRHIPTDRNFADILTKPVKPHTFRILCSRVLFRRPPFVPLPSATDTADAALPVPSATDTANATVPAPSSNGPAAAHMPAASSLFPDTMPAVPSLPPNDDSNGPPFLPAADDTPAADDPSPPILFPDPSTL